MKEYCIFEEKDLKQAFADADFETVETLYFDSGEDVFGDEYSYVDMLMRCRKCGALCLKIERNNWEFLPFGDNYDTLYAPVADLEDAKNIRCHIKGQRRYIREISNEFRGESYFSFSPDD